MPRSSAASQIGSKSGCVIERASVPRAPRTGVSGTAKARQPSSRVRVSSATVASTSEKSIWVDRHQAVGVAGDERRRPVVPAAPDARQQVDAAGPAGLHERADEERRVEELDVDAPLVAPRQPGRRRRRTGRRSSAAAAPAAARRSAAGGGRSPGGTRSKRCFGRCASGSISNAESWNPNTLLATSKNRAGGPSSAASPGSVRSTQSSGSCRWASTSMIRIGPWTVGGAVTDRQADARRVARASAATASRQPQRWGSSGLMPEAELADELVGEQRVAGVEAAHPHVAEDLLEAVALERAGAAAEVERPVDDVDGLVDHELPGGDQAHRPVGVVDARRPSRAAVRSSSASAAS